MGLANSYETDPNTQQVLQASGDIAVILISVFFLLYMGWALLFVVFSKINKKQQYVDQNKYSQQLIVLFIIYLVIVWMGDVWNFLVGVVHTHEWIGILIAGAPLVYAIKLSLGLTQNKFLQEVK